MLFPEEPFFILRDLEDFAILSVNGIFGKWRSEKNAMRHQSLIPNRFLFHIEMECGYREGLDELQELPECFTLPDFEVLEDPQVSDGIFSRKARGGKEFYVRSAWNERGIAFQFFVSGKSKELWCNPDRPDESDRIELWLDTRNVHDVHRATRYCHRFVCFPTGSGREGDEASVLFQPVSRTKQIPNEIPDGAMKIRSHVQRNCYSVFLYLSASALTGFDTREFRHLGIAWALIDRELPMKTLTAGAPFPFMEDPSLWYSLFLKED